MVVSSVALVVLLANGRTIQSLFFGLGVLNAVVAVYIYTVIPEFLLRFVGWGAANIVYRLRITGASRRVRRPPPRRRQCLHAVPADR